MWGWVLKGAVAVGLDKWARRKVGDLISKAKDKAKAKVEGLQQVQALIATPSGGTAAFRGTDGRDYVVRVERQV
jgi:hypothetical protein